MFISSSAVHAVNKAFFFHFQSFVIDPFKNVKKSKMSEITSSSVREKWIREKLSGVVNFFLSLFSLSLFLSVSFSPGSFSGSHIFSRTGQSRAHTLTHSCTHIRVYVHRHRHTHIEEVVLYVLWQLCGKSLWVWPEKKGKNRIEPSSCCDSTGPIQISLLWDPTPTRTIHTHCISQSALVSRFPHSPSVSLCIFILILFYSNLCLNRGICGKKCRMSLNNLGGRKSEHMAQMQGEEEMELSNTQRPIYSCSLSSGLLSAHTLTEITCVCMCVFEREWKLNFCRQIFTTLSLPILKRSQTLNQSFVSRKLWHWEVWNVLRLQWFHFFPSLQLHFDG